MAVFSVDHFSMDVSSVDVFTEYRRHDVQNRFCPGNVQERLARGTQRTTRLMVGYEVMKVSRLLNGEDLVGYGGDFKIYSRMDREPGGIVIGRVCRFVFVYSFDR